MNSTRVISLSSGKGGVGKTSLAVNLGKQLAVKGKNVLLIDGDWSLGKLGIALGIRPQWTIDSVVEGKIGLRDAIQPIGKNLSLLASPSGVVGFEELNEAARYQLYFQMEQLQGQFDVILLDHGSGVHPSVLEFAAASHHQIIITTPEPTSYTDAYAIMKILSKKYAIRNFSLVVTMAPAAAETEAVVSRFCDVARDHLEVRVTHLDSFPWEPKLAEAFRRQKAFVELWPDSDFAAKLMKLAERLLSLPLAPSSGMRFFQELERTAAYERDELCQA